jgi:hypothetical protein
VKSNRLHGAEAADGFAENISRTSAFEVQNTPMKAHRRPIVMGARSFWRNRKDRNMFRVLKWTTPLVAFAMLLALGSASRADEAKKETGTVSGTVLDKEGHAAPGLQVRLFHPFERGQRRGGGEAKVEKQNADPGAGAAAGEKQEKPRKGNKGAKGEKGDRPKPVATTSTDKDGKFTMTDVPVGKYVVMANARGVGGARQEVEVTAGSEAKVELKLQDRPNRAEKKAEKRAEKKKGEGATE